MKYYICGVDFQHELGETDIILYKSIEALKEKNKCWDECGIVEIELEVKKHKWLVKQDLSKMFENAISSDEVRVKRRKKK